MAAQPIDRENLGYANDRQHVRNVHGRLVGAFGRAGQQVVVNGGMHRVGRVGAGRRYELQDPPQDNGALRTDRYVLRGGAPPTTLAAMVPDIWARANREGAGFRGVHLRFVNAFGQDEWRTIRHFRDEADLLAQLTDMEYGAPQHGSDVVTPTYVLDTSRFFIRHLRLVGRAGRATTSTRTTPLYKLSSYKGADNDCIFNILRAVQPGAKTGARSKTLRRELGLPEGAIPCTIECMKPLADYYRLSIEVVGPGLHIEREFADSSSIGNTCHAVATPNTLLLVEPEVREGHVVVHCENEHYEHVREFYPVELCPYTGDHLAEVGERTKKQLRDRILDQRLMPDVEGSPTRTFYWCGTPPPCRKAKPTRVVRRMVLVFDFETTYNLDTAHLEPYAVSWHDYPIDRQDSDFADAVAQVALGPDCADRLMDYILQAPRDVAYTIVSFNGARFDNFVLAQAAARREALSDVFYAGGMLRDVRIGRHSTIDLCKLCPMRLDDACKSFATSPVKLAGFPHSEPQQARAEGRLEAWIEEKRVLLTDYVTTDVLATCSLAVKLEAVFREAVGIAPIEGKVGTIAGLAWRAFQEQTPEMPEPPADKEMDAFLRRCITGGRTQNFEAPGFTTAEPCRMVDVCSLYPTAMSGARAELVPDCVGYGRYPLGQAVPTEVYMPGKLGFYHVRVVNQPIPNILPRRGETLDWACREVFETYAASPSIELIRHQGGEVVVIPDEEGRVGYYYERDTRGLFDAFLGPIIQGKSQEDEYKERKDERYNPARREALKLIMNSLSGKWAQAQYDDAALLVKGAANQVAAERKMVGGSATWFPIWGPLCLLVGKKPAQYKQKTAKPVQIAALIYDFSRAYMWHVVYSRYHPIYTDTDSALVRRADYDRFRHDFPQLDPHGRLKGLGDLEEELGGDSRHIIVIAPKMYYVQGPKGVKARAKGVTLGRDYVLDEGIVGAVREASLERVWNWWFNPREWMHSTVNPRPFFERIRDAGEAHVLCSTLRRGVDGEGFFLAQRFLVKTIVNPLLVPAGEAGVDAVVAEAEEEA